MTVQFESLKYKDINNRDGHQECGGFGDDKSEDVIFSIMCNIALTIF